MFVQYHSLSNQMATRTITMKSLVIYFLVPSSMITCILLLWINLLTGLQVTDEERALDCILPTNLSMTMYNLSGTYTPPSPDTSLHLALSRTSSKDYNFYCLQWDPSTGFPEDNNEEDTRDCGRWQEEYTRLHQRELSRLSRLQTGHKMKTAPRIAAYYCDENPKHKIRSGCGGLADRMTGMLSTFFYALLSDRAYLANWREGDPAALEQLFDKPNIDWSYRPDDIQRLFGNQGQPTFQDVNLLNLNWATLKKKIFPNGADQDFRSLWNASFVEIRSNRGFVIQTLKESKLYKERLARLGLTTHNAVRCISNYLFRPTFGARQFISAYKMLFGMESVLSIGVQIRTNDTALLNPTKDSNSLHQWAHFFNCANQLVDAKRRPHHKQVVYFLVTDSSQLRDQFVQLNANGALRKQFFGAHHADITALVTGLPIKHIDAETVARKALHDTSDHLVAGVQSAVIENWLLSATDYRLISVQGYGKLAAFRSKDPNSTIQLQKSYAGGELPDDYCSRPDAFVSFETLSSLWSLG